MSVGRRLLRAWRRRRDGWTITLLLGTLAFALSAGGWTWRADRVLYDFGLGAWSRPAPADIVIVAIDDASVEAIGRWPWPRAVHSTLLGIVAQARPRAIGLDLVLSEADPEPAQDELLAQVLRRAAPVVLPVAWQAGGAGWSPRLLEPSGPLRAAAQLGAAEAAVDDDGVLRHAFLHTGHAGRSYPHLALALLQAGGERLDPAFPVVREPPGPAGSAAQLVRSDRFLIRYAGPPGHVQRLSYVDVLRGAVPAQALAGRYVLIGMTALGLGDTLATPVNRQQHAMAGVEVLANALHTMRSGDTLRALPGGLAALLSMGLIVLLLAAFELVGTRAALALALGSVPLAFGASLLALGAGHWWSPVPYALAAALAYPFWSWRRLERAVDELDVEIRRLEPERGVPLAVEPEPPPPVNPRDRLASRLNTLQIATETVRSARRFLADALAGLPTAMVVADERGRVLLANALAAALFELETARDMHGLDLPGLLAEFEPQQPVDWQELFVPTAAAPGGLAVEARLARLGDYLIHVAGVVLLGQQRWVVTFADVTPIKQAQRRRDETLAFISHDLRSPASSIMLLADLQLQRQAGMAQQELLTEFRRLAARTLQLSDDFVRVAHAESRPLQPVRVGLGPLLDEVLSELRPQAQAVEVVLRTALDDAQATWVFDRALVARALGNLVSNAIKHSPRGAAVDVQATQVGDRLLIRVHDCGPGLSAQQRRQLEQEAQGLPAGDARGVGLGLLFVQRVAARHEGELAAQAGDEGVGTVFELRLGRLAAPAEQP